MALEQRVKEAEKEVPLLRQKVAIMKDEADLMASSLHEANEDRQIFESLKEELKSLSDNVEQKQAIYAQTLRKKDLENELLQRQINDYIGQI
jgi:UDP-N-acetylglucosamine 2-epimerase